MNHLLREAGIGLLELVYPPGCLVCRELGPEPVCAACRAGFAPVPLPICKRCGGGLRMEACMDCELHPIRSLTMVRAAGTFDGTLRDAIHRMKYQNRPALATHLGQFLVEYLRTSPFGRCRFDAVIPVPLHGARERARGYNQAALLAREVAIGLSAPLELRCLSRLRATQAQVSLMAEDRRSNVAGAFAARPNLAAGRRILLVDDVGTTLSTADCCAEALRDAGVRDVCLALVARSA